MMLRVILFLAVAVLAAARDPLAVDFSIESPGWGGEVIALPPGFAPTMSIQGVEDIRFAPGMFKPKAEDFFSYLFVIVSNTGQRFDHAFICQELLAYYQGLAKAVSKGAIDPSGFALELEPIKGLRTHAGYRGSLDWVEPFATRKPQTLYFDVQVQQHTGKDYLIVSVSPQGQDHEVWKALQKVRASFRVVKP
jgi:hypothetical protein